MRKNNRVIQLRVSDDLFERFNKFTNDNGVIGLDGNISSFMNYKNKFPSTNIPQTGGSDNTSLYGILTIASGMLSVYLLRRKNA